MSVIANVFSAELDLPDNNLKLSVTSSVDDKSLVVSGLQVDIAKVKELVIKLDAPAVSLHLAYQKVE